MLNTDFADWPLYTQEECDSVVSVLKSNRVNYWTGEKCRRFEEQYAEFAQSKYAISLSNGTVAIELALRALDIGEGDEVIVTPRSYVASVTPVFTVGASPIFADIDLNSQNISADTIAEKISNKTKAIIVVHLAGHPAEMDEIVTLAKKNNIRIIEDCAQAHGAQYKGKPVGKSGDIAAWSFCQDKIITTGGEGGMVTTDNEQYWKSMWAYKDHGKSLDAVMEPRKKENEFRWLHESVGSNYRMSEMQAAIGIIQLGRMQSWHKKRLDNANAIWSACSETRWLEIPKVPNYAEHAAYKAYAFIDFEALPSEWNRSQIIDEFVKRRVPVSSGGCPEIYKEKLFENTQSVPKAPLVNADKLGKTSLMFLVHPTLTEKQVAITCDAIKEIDKIIFE
ncbi:DegT/DnrJ/EryC1/StrS family aminotransferase [Granulosicoccus antarcticus]|uniref:GDP-perosamine synthase n=1 Tax=Granulosicoccus antarcticus IMCC3135 TaxID=1192854 RepID=A0A2Z2NXA7_9GAMM|nr:DegT/DnrJ/EryC1/StrS aminotransferase family protein [Granulosicoccus antarcticus]ASJ74611.1 GDP-perosamine synthase [Granulosicoccus antarcticus IMCC3135]